MFDTEPEEDTQPQPASESTDPGLDAAMKELSNKDPNEMLKDIQGDSEEPQK